MTPEQPTGPVRKLQQQQQLRGLQSLDLKVHVAKYGLSRKNVDTVIGRFFGKGADNLKAKLKSSQQELTGRKLTTYADAWDPKSGSTMSKGSSTCVANTPYDANTPVYGEPTCAEPYYWFASDTSATMQNAITKFTKIATCFWGNLGPLHILGFGDDAAASTTMMNNFCTTYIADADAKTGTTYQPPRQACTSSGIAR